MSRQYSGIEVIEALYKGILGREPDRAGFENWLERAEDGLDLAAMIRAFVASDEHRNKALAIPDKSSVRLPNLIDLYPGKYLRHDEHSSVFHVTDDGEFAFLEHQIIANRYYDSSDVYSPRIDLDKTVSAAMVIGLGAGNCIELGCFTGPVLSLLAARNVDVCGVDASHLAFVLAYPNIRGRLRFGDLLDQDFDRTFDVFLAMDVLEHLNPVAMDAYVRKIRQITAPDGFAIVNSPMFGEDDVFGTVFPQYIPEWVAAGDTDFWRNIHCDEAGWPVHGHLVNASPQWWEATFLRHGLVRDRRIECHLQGLLADFFRMAPARKSLFILRRDEWTPDYARIEGALLDEIGALPIPQP